MYRPVCVRACWQPWRLVPRCGSNVTACMWTNQQSYLQRFIIFSYDMRKHGSAITRWDSNWSAQPRDWKVLIFGLRTLEIISRHIKLWYFRWCNQTLVVHLLKVFTWHGSKLIWMHQVTNHEKLTFCKKKGMHSGWDRYPKIPNWNVANKTTKTTNYNPYSKLPIKTLSFFFPQSFFKPISSVYLGIFCVSKC